MSSDPSTPENYTLVTGSHTFAFSPEGVLLWQQSDAGDGGWIHVDESGNSYVGGRRYLDVFRVTKHDPSGVLVWSQTWPAAAVGARPHCFTLGKDGAYIGGQILAHGRAVVAKFAP